MRFQYLTMVARVAGLTIGLTLASMTSAGGQQAPMLQTRGQCYWVVYAGESRIGQHLQPHTALNTLLTAHRSYPIGVPLWYDVECTGDLNRHHPNLPIAPEAEPLPPDSVVPPPPDSIEPEPPDMVVDPVELPDTLPDVVPDPEPPDVPVYHVPTPDSIGSAVVIEAQDDGSWRVVMGPGGYTFVRWYRSVAAGIWKVIVTHDGTGGGVLFGEEAFPLTEGEAVDVFYRSFAEPTGFILELDNLNAPMERVIRGLQLVPTDLEEAIDAVVVPAEIELAEGDEAQLCALAIMPTGQAILDTAQVAIPECRAALDAYRAGGEL